MEQRPFRIVISGGGTGGHVFPAIAIANAIQAIHPESEILFVGAKGRMEMHKVPEAGYNIKGLWISGIQRRLTIKNLMFPLKLISSILKARKIINQFKPDVAVGVGGYASGPLGYAAAKKNVPLLLQEQNSYPGITNKWLAKKATKICIAYEGLERFFEEAKLRHHGNPVRDLIVNNTRSLEEGRQFFGVPSTRKMLLIIGGSLGARGINEAVKANVEDLVLAGFSIVWQCGQLYKDELVSLESEHVRILPFIKEMDLAYAGADIIVSRAGALSISELCIVGKPTVLMPSPNVSEDHQTKNAMALVEKDAAILLKDTDGVLELSTRLIDLKNNEPYAQLLSSNLKQLAKKNAAESIAEEVLSLIKRS